MNQKCTIKDIAELAGVSPTAVSFVLNHKKGVSRDTEEKILRIIRENDFQPSLASRRLSAKKSFNVAFIYPASASPFTDYYYQEIASGAVNELTNLGYNAVFAPLSETGGRFNLPNIIRANDADGAVIFQKIDPELLQMLDGCSFPYVFVDLHTQNAKYTNVSIDYEKSVLTQVEYLYERGHRKIAFLGSNAHPDYFSHCFSGYQSALNQHNLPLYPNWIAITSNDQSSVESAIESFLRSGVKPTAVLCMSDMLAIHGINGAKKLGLHLPENLSFISIDDIIPSRYVQPALTTVTYENFQMGVLAAQLLFKKMRGEEVESIVVQSDRIIERDSVYDLR